MIFVVFRNPDGTEWGCTSKDRWDNRTRERGLSHDVDGVPMEFVEEIEAKDFEAALDIYNRRWDEPAQP